MLHGKMMKQLDAGGREESPEILRDRAEDEERIRQS
jgi:hypothetical protein